MKTKLTIVLLLLCRFTTAQTAARFDILITEIMADPSPQVGLPNTEFIEIRNVSAKILNLSGWKLGDASGAATINSNVMLQPDSFLVLCSNSAVASLSPYGTTLGISSFPSLDNSGDQVYLLSKEGMIIHAIEYHTSWYRNALKSEGGWSLEMIDTRNPCSGFSNWTASRDLKGGSPGKRNSVDDVNPDAQPPKLIRSFATDANTITLVFDEPIDSAIAVIPANYSISDGIAVPLNAIAVPPLFMKVQLQAAFPLVRDKIYTVTAGNVRDCSGNLIGNASTVKTGWASTADQMDIVINEILFNPRPDGVDYLELYNRSDKIIDLKDTYIANRNSGGVIGSIKQVSPEKRLLFPGDYLVVTEDPAPVQRQYTVKQPDAFAVISPMPSYPDDRGTVVLLNAQGAITDELAYNKNWHFKLVDNDQGISLERIDHNSATQYPANWHSAATGSGYGTPTYQNSQFRATGIPEGTIAISPLVFSPDNDGHDDFATITYRFPEPGYVCNITIFDAGGRPVRYLTRNALCGPGGYFRWDGLDEKSNKLPMGVYVVYAEIFNLQGKSRRFKEAVTLAGRL
jgi:hypothetical protein